MAQKSHEKIRRHGKLHELPEEIRSEVNALLIQPSVTYDDVAAYLKEKGFEIGKSSIGRYGQWFFNEVRELEMLKDQASLLTSDPGKALLLEKLTATMITKKLAIALQMKDFNVLKQAKLIDAFAKLQRSSTQREQWAAEVKTKVSKTADAVARVARKGGLSDDTVNDIKARILGIAK